VTTRLTLLPYTHHHHDAALQGFMGAQGDEVVAADGVASRLSSAIVDIKVIFSAC
jgi:hypothetical protein